jgi:aryl-alcohol dehydrogenase-like predicted oxidoreductase
VSSDLQALRTGRRVAELPSPNRIGRVVAPALSTAEQPDLVDRRYSLSTRRPGGDECEGSNVRYRRLGSTGFDASEIGFGAWAIGGDAWGTTDDGASLRALHAAADAGVTFFDTADVYGDGHSERLLARFVRERGGRLADGRRIVVATKIGRRAPLDLASYTRRNLTDWIDRCRENLGTGMLDLVQLHCLPTQAYYEPDIFGFLAELKADGAIAHYGVSVEKVEEGLKALEYPDVETVQIIFNIFRQRPSDLFLARAAARDVGVIVRVPLASGLLAGKFRRDSAFEPRDHRAYNRHGEEFDRGETFAGVDYETGLAAVERLRGILPDGPMSGWALRWILMHEGVSTVIAGAKNEEQARSNAAASELPALDEATMASIRALYREAIAPLVHQRW